MNPLRTWITAELQRLLPFAPLTYWSDTDGAQFYALTGLTHEDLMLKWEGPLDPDTKKRTGKGYDPTFTTCTSFLPIFASKVRRAGGLPVQRRNAFSGKMVDINYHAFAQQKEPGWVANAPGLSPQPGDFFQYGTPTWTMHVGVILDVSGNNWAKVAGGAGGRKNGHDGVKRTMLEAHAEPVMGWVDADVYFAGWTDLTAASDDDDPYADL